MNCSIAQGLEQVGDWWSLLIVRDALLGATRFQHFEQNLGIAKNVLAARLAKLVEHEILERQRLNEPGERYAYRLTRKGRDLWILLTALRLWTDRWVIGEDRRPLQVCERDSGREVARLVATDAEGVPVDASKLEAIPGPGWPRDWTPDDADPWATPPLDASQVKNRKRMKP